MEIKKLNIQSNCEGKEGLGACVAAQEMAQQLRAVVFAKDPVFIPIPT